MGGFAANAHFDGTSIMTKAIDAEPGLVVVAVASLCSP